MSFCAITIGLNDGKLIAHVPAMVVRIRDRGTANICTPSSGATPQIACGRLLIAKVISE